MNISRTEMKSEFTFKFTW